MTIKSEAATDAPDPNKPFTVRLSISHGDSTETKEVGFPSPALDDYLDGVTRKAEERLVRTFTRTKTMWSGAQMVSMMKGEFFSDLELGEAVRHLLERYVTGARTSVRENGMLWAMREIETRWEEEISTHWGHHKEIPRRHLFTSKALRHLLDLPTQVKQTLSNTPEMRAYLASADGMHLIRDGDWRQLTFRLWWLMRLDVNLQKDPLLLCQLPFDSKQLNQVLVTGQMHTTGFMKKEARLVTTATLDKLTLHLIRKIAVYVATSGMPVSFVSRKEISQAIGIFSTAIEEFFVSRDKERDMDLRFALEKHWKGTASHRRVRPRVNDIVNQSGINVNVWARVCDVYRWPYALWAAHGVPSRTAGGSPEPVDPPQTVPRPEAAGPEDAVLLELMACEMGRQAQKQ